MLMAKLPTTTHAHNPKLRVADNNFLFPSSVSESGLMTMK